MSGRSKEKRKRTPCERWAVTQRRRQQRRKGPSAAAIAATAFGIAFITRLADAAWALAMAPAAPTKQARTYLRAGGATGQFLHTNPSADDATPTKEHIMRTKTEPSDLKSTLTAARNMDAAALASVAERSPDAARYVRQAATEGTNAAWLPIKAAMRLDDDACLQRLENIGRKMKREELAAAACEPDHDDMPVGMTPRR